MDIALNASAPSNKAHLLNLAPDAWRGIGNYIGLRGLELLANTGAKSLPSLFSRIQFDRLSGTLSHLRGHPTEWFSALHANELEIWPGRTTHQSTTFLTLGRIASLVRYACVVARRELRESIDQQAAMDAARTVKWAITAMETKAHYTLCRGPEDGSSALDFCSIKEIAIDDSIGWLQQKDMQSLVFSPTFFFPNFPCIQRLSISSYSSTNAEFDVRSAPYLTSLKLDIEGRSCMEATVIAGESLVEIDVTLPLSSPLSRLNSLQVPNLQRLRLVDADWRAYWRSHEATLAPTLKTLVLIGCSIGEDAWNAAWPQKLATLKLYDIYTKRAGYNYQEWDERHERSVKRRDLKLRCINPNKLPTGLMSFTFNVAQTKEPVFVSFDTVRSWNTETESLLTSQPVPRALPNGEEAICFFYLAPEALTTGVLNCPHMHTLNLHKGVLFGSRFSIFPPSLICLSLSGCTPRETKSQDQFNAALFSKIFPKIFFPPKHNPPRLASSSPSSSAATRANATAKLQQVQLGDFKVKWTLLKPLITVSSDIILPNDAVDAAIRRLPKGTAASTVLAALAPAPSPTAAPSVAVSTASVAVSSTTSVAVSNASVAVSNASLAASNLASSAPSSSSSASSAPVQSAATPSASLASSPTSSSAPSAASLASSAPSASSAPLVPLAASAASASLKKSQPHFINVSMWLARTAMSVIGKEDAVVWGDPFCCAAQIGKFWQEAISASYPSNFEYAFELPTTVQTLAVVNVPKLEDVLGRDAFPLPLASMPPPTDGPTAILGNRAHLPLESLCNKFLLGASIAWNVLGTHLRHLQLIDVTTTWLTSHQPWKEMDLLESLFVSIVASGIAHKLNLNDFASKSLKHLILLNVDNTITIPDSAVVKFPSLEQLTMSESLRDKQIQLLHARAPNLKGVHLQPYPREGNSLKNRNSEYWHQYLSYADWMRKDSQRVASVASYVKEAADAQFEIYKKAITAITHTEETTNVDFTHPLKIGLKTVKAESMSMAMPSCLIFTGATWNTSLSKDNMRRSARAGTKDPANKVINLESIKNRVLTTLLPGHTFQRLALCPFLHEWEIPRGVTTLDLTEDCAGALSTWENPIDAPPFLASTNPQWLYAKDAHLSVYLEYLPLPATLTTLRLACIVESTATDIFEFLPATLLHLHLLNQTPLNLKKRPKVKEGRKLPPPKIVDIYAPNVTLLGGGRPEIRQWPSSLTRLVCYTLGAPPHLSQLPANITTAIIKGSILRHPYLAPKATTAAAAPVKLSPPAKTTAQRKGVNRARAEPKQTGKLPDMDYSVPKGCPPRKKPSPYDAFGGGFYGMHAPAPSHSYYGYADTSSEDDSY